MFRKTAAMILSLLFVNGPNHFPLSQTDDAIDSHCNAVMSLIRSKDPRAYERHFERAKVPDSFAGLANEKLPNTVDLVAVPPVTEDDYKMLFFSGKDKPAQPATKAQRKKLTWCVRTSMGNSV